MRKVRVWDDALNEMLYGRVEQFDDMLGFRFEKHLETENPMYMWETGLKDKNGKEIYEGDIISTDLERPFNIVVFRNGAFMFQCHDNGKDYYDYMFSVDEEFDYWKFGEVIGNIYENPELLKGEKNA